MLKSIDFVWCLLSIALSAASNPLLVLQRLWPYLTLLVSFGGFIMWNGGVVLGMRSLFLSYIPLTGFRGQIKPCSHHPSTSATLYLAIHGLLFFTIDIPLCYVDIEAVVVRNGV